MPKIARNLIPPSFEAAGCEFASYLDEQSRQYHFRSDTISPIERLLGEELFAYVCFNNSVAAMRGVSPRAIFKKEILESYDTIRKANGFPIITIWQQVHVERYIADFVLRYERRGNLLWIAIECDGHDFHERTKFQAAHDRARDRFFQSVGLSVLRFTGSEIWADLPSIADQIFTFAEGRVTAKADADSQG